MKLSKGLEYLIEELSLIREHRLESKLESESIDERVPREIVVHGCKVKVVYKVKGRGTIKSSSFRLFISESEQEKRKSYHFDIFCRGKGR
jgi:hypothetical protein